MPKGIVRKIDELGRIVVPKEIRDNLAWDKFDEVDITVSGKIVSIRKVGEDCVICGAEEGLEYIYGQPVCVSCRTAAARTIRR